MAGFLCAVAADGLNGVKFFIVLSLTMDFNYHSPIPSIL